MDKPNYVIKTNEAVLMSIETDKSKNVIKICTWIIIGIVLIGSFLLDINIFSELSFGAKIFLIIIVLGLIFYDGKKEYTPSPMELYFFDDYLMMYLPKRYYSKRVSRKQIEIMKYSEISKCVLKANSNRIQIYGDGKAIWYNYNKDGSLPEKPTKEKQFTEGMIYFNIQFATDIDFIKEIETHSPLKVIIEND